MELAPNQKLSALYSKWSSFPREINYIGAWPVQRRYMRIMEDVEVLHLSSSTGISEEDFVEFCMNMDIEHEKTTAYLAVSREPLIHDRAFVDRVSQEWLLFCARIGSSIVDVPLFSLPARFNPEVVVEVEEVELVPVVAPTLLLGWRTEPVVPVPVVVLKRRSGRKRSAIVRYGSGC